MSNGTLENLNKQLIALNGNLEIFNSLMRQERNADPKTGVPNETKGDVIDVTDNEEEEISIPTLDGEPIITKEELDEAREPVIAAKNTWLLMKDGTKEYVAKGEEMPDEFDIDKRITKKEFTEEAPSDTAEDVDEFDDDEGDAFEDDDEEEVISFEHFKNIMKLFGSAGQGARAKKVLAKASSNGSEKLSSFADDAEGRKKAIAVLEAKWPKFDKAAEKVGYKA